jgi:peptidoglycan/LPS O-acetylase OafA/YrhL
MKKVILSPLTGIRFFAAIYVILFHNIGFFKDSPGFVFNFLKHGYVGVSLFFVLSGFILTYNYIEAFGENYLDNKKFWLARFLRLYPIYFISIIVSLPPFFYFLGKTLPLYPAVFKGIAITTFTIPLLQSWITFFLGQLNAPGWSLSVEAFLYFTFPFVAPCLAKIKNKNLIFILIFSWILSILPNIILLALQQYKIAIDPDLPSIITSPYPLYSTFISSFPLFHLPQFMIGVIIAIIYMRDIEQKKYKLSNYINNQKVQFLHLAEIVIFSLIIIIMAQDKIFIESSLNNGLISPLFGLLFYVLAYEKGIISKLLSLPVFMMLGEASFCMYIFQAPVRTYSTLCNGLVQ